MSSKALNVKDRCGNIVSWILYIGGQVVEVLHASGHGVPLGTVGDATLPGKVALGSSITGGMVILGHVGMRSGVGFCQVTANE